MGPPIYNNGGCGGGVLVTAVQPWNPVVMGATPFTNQQQQQQQQQQQAESVPFSPTSFIGCRDRWTPSASPVVSAGGSGGVDDRVVMTTAFTNDLHAAITAGGLIAATPALPRAAFLPQVRKCTFL